MVTTPSASDLKARYPEFTPVADAFIDAIIAEAVPMVDDCWVETDQKPAILAFAAHLMAMEGYPARAANSQAPIPNAGKEVIMRKVGDVQTQYAQTNSAPSTSSGLLSTASLTPYGRRFAQLLKLNAPLIAVT